MMNAFTLKKRHSQGQSSQNNIISLEFFRQEVGVVELSSVRAILQVTDENPTKFFGRRNVFDYSQTTSKERATSVQKQFQESHLERDRYIDKDPNRFHTEAWLRDRVRSQDSSLNLKYNQKNEQDRMKSEMSKTLKTFEPMNTKIYYFFKLREPNKNQWVSQKTFVSMSGKKDKPWPTVPIKEGESDYEPFTQKFQSIEDFSRKRDTLKEVGTNEWDANSHSDSVWQKRIQTSNSLRNYKSIFANIHTINGKIQSDVSTARENLDSMQSFKRIKSHSSLKYLKRVKDQNSTTESRDNTSTTSQSIVAPIPVPIKIQEGNLQQIEDYLNTKKEFTQKASLLYLPDQQINSSLNKRFKVPTQITDQYLLERIQLAKKKTYYKTAELMMNNKSDPNLLQQQVSITNNSNSIPQYPLASQDSSGMLMENKRVVINDLVTNIDISQLIMNEKLNDFSKDNSPLVSTKRQPSTTSVEDQTNQEQYLQNQQYNKEYVQDQSPTLKDELSPKLRSLQQKQQEKKRTHIIQEDSDETDEDSPEKRKSKLQTLNRLTLDGLKKHSSEISPSKRQQIIRETHQLREEIERQRKELQIMSPTIHKEMRQKQLQLMMNNYFEMKEKAKLSGGSKHSSPKRKTSQKQYQ